MLQALYMLPNIHSLQIKVLLLHCTDVSQEELHKSQLSYPSRKEELDQSQALYPKM